MHTSGAGVARREEREHRARRCRSRRARPGRSARARARRAEEPDPFRLCFERDLDRIKHSRPWRRLAGKCQVFIAPEDDHLRTRLTHAVEVAQVATGIARADRAVRAAHRGDRARARLRPRSRPATRRRRRSRRTCPAATTTRSTAPTSRSTPLNLCAETLDGVRNHSWRRPAPATPEGEVVAWADRIAYVCHDFEDAVRAGILDARRPARRRSPTSSARSRSRADRRVRARGARRGRARPATSG